MIFLITLIAARHCVPCRSTGRNDGYSNNSNFALIKNIYIFPDLAKYEKQPLPKRFFHLHLSDKK
jgi:hypothetical protein